MYRAWYCCMKSLKVWDERLVPVAGTAASVGPACSG